MFYLYCANSDIPINLNIMNLIEKIFSNIDFTISNSLNEANETVQNFVKNIDKDKYNDKENEINNNNNNINIDIDNKNYDN
jgi:hypothetical protein